MTKIGYRFINWALLFLAGFIVYEFTRNIDGMEGVVVSECLKSDGYKKDFCLIDLDNSFMYVLVEKNDVLEIGDKVRVKAPNKYIITESYALQTIPLIIFAILCFAIAIAKTFIALDDDWNYTHLKN